MKFARATIAFILTHGIDRILSALAAFAILFIAPDRGGWHSWVVSMAIVGCVLYAVRPE